MPTTIGRLWVRLGIALRQNLGALLFITAWLATNAVVLAKVFGMERTTAMMTAACITKASGGWPRIYQSFTEVVVFGLVASLVLTNVTRRYRPEETCRALAARSRDHVVVVGWSNLGRRVAALVQQAGRPLVVVERDASLVAELVREERPLVVGSAEDRQVLVDAAVAHAKVVMVATDDLETAAVACRLVRELSATCELVVRCPDEDVGAILARTYRARAVSTSRLAGAFIQERAVKARAKAVLVLGRNSVGDRAVEALAHKRIPIVHADVTEDRARLEEAGVRHADMIVICDDDLGKNLIRIDRIRSMNRRAKIICRAFHDEAAELLARPPFECEVLSTSKHAAASLVRSGALREAGIDDLPAPSAPRALATA